MTQELTDLRASILEGRYADALAIVDELEGMSKKEILRKIKSFLRVLLIHLIKNQVEQRLTGSWVSSIRVALEEVQEINLKENKTSYYVSSDEWATLLEEEVMEKAIAGASEEVMGGRFSRAQLSEIVDKPQVIQTATRLLGLTQTYSAKELPAILDEYLAQLPAGEDWLNRHS
ncbi:MAG: DUF29 domain-containing protein [Oscillatoria princeps RMCB-10]|jgi:hypothetical protein|nr:DUF29 domain-containing protein [Oscillatoria princeps RMCB-10]